MDEFLKIASQELGVEFKECDYEDIYGKIKHDDTFCMEIIPPHETIHLVKHRKLLFLVRYHRTDRLIHFQSKYFGNSTKVKLANHFYPHFKLRLKERYGLDISIDEYLQLEDDLRHGKGVRVDMDSHSSTFACCLRQHVIKVVRRCKSKELVTCIDGYISDIDRKKVKKNYEQPNH